MNTELKQDGAFIGRRGFIGGMAALAASGVSAQTTDLDIFQKELDAIKPADYVKFRDLEKDDPEMLAKFPGLRRYDEAFDRVFAEAKATVVTGKPAIWYVYNMGFLVKTKQAFFSVDLCHRQGYRAAPFLDFALITHNHGDHYTQNFYRAMNGAGKTVINNFIDNYGAHFSKKKNIGGYTRTAKTFTLKDVTIRTALSDHNRYLIDYTSTFEIIADGFFFYHTGDSQNITKLNPSAQPDLWAVHPYNGLRANDGLQKFSPKLTMMVHLQELGHALGRARWTFKNGEKAVADAESIGAKAIMPLWGTRIV